MQAWYWERGKEQENSSNDNQILPSGGKGEAILDHTDVAEIEAMGMLFFVVRKVSKQPKWPKKGDIVK